VARYAPLVDARDIDALQMLYVDDYRVGRRIGQSISCLTVGSRWGSQCRPSPRRVRRNGVPFVDRHHRLEQSIEVLRSLWRAALCECLDRTTFGGRDNRRPSLTAPCWLLKYRLVGSFDEPGPYGYRHPLSY
jgi:hypothetical protein